MMGASILNLFQFILKLSLTGSYVILLVIVVRLLLHRAPKWCSYLLWAVVFLRLICPVFPETAFSLIPSRLIQPWQVSLQGEIIPSGQQMQGNLRQVQQGALNPSQQQNPSVDGLQSGEGPNPGEAFNDGSMYDEENRENTGGSDKKTAGDGARMWVSIETLRFLALLWLIGMTATASYHTVCYWRLKKKVRAGVETEPGVREMKGEHLSFVLGILRPQIYLSQGLEKEARKVILMHERIHLKRKDYLIKPVALGIACIHWFNPLVWLAFYLMNKDCEMSCDEKVVRILGEESKKVYSYALLDEAAANGGAGRRRGGICSLLSFGEDNVKNRIKHVLHYKKAPVWMIACTIIVLAVIVAGLLCNPGRQETEGNTDGNTFQQLVTAGETIDTLQEFEDIFGRGANVVFTRDNTGYFKMNIRKIFQQLLAATAPEDFEDYHDPVKAAKKMLYLGEGSGEVTETLHIGYPTNVMPGSIGEGTVVKIAYTFAEDNSVVEIPMVLAEESQQIWALSNGIITREEINQGKTAEADEDFLARKVFRETEDENGTVFQSSSFGIYRVDGEGMKCIFPYDTYIGNEPELSLWNGRLYFPVDADYVWTEETYDSFMYDSICVLNPDTEEYSYITLSENIQRLFPLRWMSVHSGFIFLYSEYTSDYAAVMAEAVEPVWNGMTAVQLADAEAAGAERAALGVFNRQNILEHKNTWVDVANRTADKTFALIDMDGDGLTEEISIEPDGEEGGGEYPLDSYILKAGGGFEHRWGECVNNGIWAFSPDGERIFIALYEDGPSGDPFTTVFRWEYNRLREAGGFADDLNSSSCSLEEGVIHAVVRSDAIQTDGIKVQFCLNEQGELEQIPQETYEFTNLNEIKLLEPLSLQKEPGDLSGSPDNADTFTVEPQTVRFLETTASVSEEASTDNSADKSVDNHIRWILLETQEGEIGWFSVSDIYYIDQLEKEAWEVFEGLSFAG